MTPVLALVLLAASGTLVDGGYEATWREFRREFGLLADKCAS